MSGMPLTKCSSQAHCHLSILLMTGSDEWNALDEDEKSSLGLELEQDGEFWMSFEDFAK